MNKPNKKMAIIAGCTALGLICIGGGAFAFFTAEKETPAQTVNVGTVNIDTVNINLGDPVQGNGSVNTDVIHNTNNNILTNMNPGDLIPLNFTITNTGNKSIEEKTYVYIIFDNNGNGDYGTYSNFIESISVVKSDGSALPATANLTRGTYTKAGKNYNALRFEVTSVLNGAGDNKETEAGATGTNADKTSITHSYALKFDLRANVHTMNEGLSIETFTQAVQYRNSQASTVGTMLDNATNIFFTEKPE